MVTLLDYGAELNRNEINMINIKIKPELNKNC